MLQGTDWVEYTYNNLNQKTEMANGSTVVNYEYFANGWLKAVKLGSALIAEYSYDQVGNRTQVDLGNDAIIEYEYDDDPRYRIESITHTPTQGDPLTIEYSDRDGDGNPTAISGVSYTYDANTRLASAGGTSYTYDWVGNRLTPGSMVYNDADQLTSWPNQHQYTYLGTGSLWQQKDSGGVVEKTYTYTAANLLESITHNSLQGEPVSSMTWDADSNRVGFTGSTGGSYAFVYDITAGIPAVIKEIGPSTTAYYIREPDGSLLARVAGSSQLFYHFDALGSTRLITDDSGLITDEYSYDAWGNASHTSGYTEQPYQYVGQLGYYTHWQDANLPLLQLGVRFYDAGIGRFTQVDPLPTPRRSDYAYVGDNPATWTDPIGKARKRSTPEGRRIPLLVPARSCYHYQPDVNGNIGRALKFIEDVIDGWDLDCPGTITIKCNDKCEWWPDQCGHSPPSPGKSEGYMTIYHDPRCRDDFCTILHELQHTCGGIGHGRGSMVIPHCGDVNR